MTVLLLACVTVSVGQHGLDWVLSYPASQLAPPRAFCRVATAVFETRRCLSASMSPWHHGSEVSAHRGYVRYMNQSFPSNYCEAKYPGCVTRPSRCLTNCSAFATSYTGYSCFCDDIDIESIHGEHLVAEGITASCDVDVCSQSPPCDFSQVISGQASAVFWEGQAVYRMYVPHARISNARVLFTLTFASPYPLMIRIVELDSYCLDGFVENMYVEQTPGSIAFVFSTSLAFSTIGFTVDDNTTEWDYAAPVVTQGPCFACECEMGFGRGVSPLCQYAEPVIGQCTTDASCKYQPPHFLTTFSAPVQQATESGGLHAPWFAVVPAVPMGANVTVVVKSLEGIYAVGKAGQRVSLLMDGMNNMYSPVTVNGPGRRLDYVRRGPASGNATVGAVEFEMHGDFIVPDQMYYIDYAAIEGGCNMAGSGSGTVRVTPHVPGTYACTFSPAAGTVGVVGARRYVVFGVWTEAVYHRVVQYFGAGIGEVTLWVDGGANAKVWYDFINGDDCIVTQRVFESRGVDVSPFFITYLLHDSVETSRECIVYPDTIVLSNVSDFRIVSGVALKKDQLEMCVAANACDIILQSSNSVQTFASATYIGVICNGQDYDTLFTAAKESILVARRQCSGTALPGTFPPVPGWESLALDNVTGLLLSGVYSHPIGADAAVLVTGVRDRGQLAIFPWQVIDPLLFFMLSCYPSVFASRVSVWVCVCVL